MIGGNRLRIDTDVARQASLSARIARGQADIARTERIALPSDDPLAANQAAAIVRLTVSRSAWLANADHALALATSAEDVLGSAATRLDRARELATSALSATLSAADRTTIAIELAGIADDLDALAATRDANGEQLFPDQARAVPVGDGVRIMPVATRADSFGTSADAMRAAAAAIAGGDATARASALTTVVAIGDRLSDVRGAGGVRAARIAAIRERMVDADARDAEVRGALIGTDVAATIARIQALSLALDASRSLFARVNARTLFDLLG